MMTSHDARRILGLGPAESPFAHLSEFRSAREKIVELLETAATPEVAAGYRRGLAEFDAALALLTLPPVAHPGFSNKPAVVGPAVAAPRVHVLDPPRLVQPAARRGWAAWLWLVVSLAGIGGGWWWYDWNTRQQQRAFEARIGALAADAAALVENRRWQEAAQLFDQIEALAPGAQPVTEGRRRIEAGIAEEQTQFIGYWTGQAIAELDAGRLDEADAAVTKVLELYPNESDAKVLRGKIAAARDGHAIALAVAAARQQLAQRQWHAAIAACRRILADSPDHPDAAAVLAEATAAAQRHQADQAKALELLEKAAARDLGQFDADALEWLREAAALDPGNAEIARRLEKMGSYTRTLKVPGDFATPAEALAAARDRDRIVLAENTWQGPLVIKAAVDLQGAGSAKTIVECPATLDNVVLLGPETKGARISGMTFRHENFHAQGRERFSVAVVQGGAVTFSDCWFRDASGHGLIVTAGGTVVASRCRFTDNAWNGAAAQGKGARLEVRESESLNNFEHGLEAWNGATAAFIRNRCEGNCRNGIHADCADAPAVIEHNQLLANREFGIVLGSAGTGRVAANTARANLLGGIVVRAAAAPLPVTGNHASANLGPGLVLERGLDRSAYADNSITANQSQQVVSDANLAAEEEPRTEAKR